MLTPCVAYSYFQEHSQEVKKINCKSGKTKPFELASTSTDTQQSTESDYALFTVIVNIILAPEVRV
jgi:hypothetical protein